MGKGRTGAYVIDADPKRLDASAIRDFLITSYWAKGRSLAQVEKSLKHSLCFGLYLGREQVGLARVITDYTTFAYLCDVYVLEAHRGQGLGKRLMRAVMAHPAITGARRAMLATRDAHGMYRKVGFVDVVTSKTLMEIVKADMYRSPG